ncbi:MAG: SMP-30/gluconolactonase/LRE family protein [Phycisphaerales bacterium]|nr:MAG: SMP-30/gluconolactonase/LRE family protein [Phycisphaerales bacterium]
MKDAVLVDHLGRKGLCGAAYLKDVEFESGVIEVDVAVDGSRSYPGINFRMQSNEEYERFYVRPHRARLYPDALQYAPVFNGVACWQLYHGEGATAGAILPANQWIHLKMEIHGTQARVFVGDGEHPTLTICDLKHGLSKGTIGVLGPRSLSAVFSNFSYRKDDALRFDDPPVAETPPGTIADWQISRGFKADQIDTEVYPYFFTIFYAQWQDVRIEPTGLVNLSRYVRREDPNGDLVFARTIVRSDDKQNVKLSFGYSDDVSIFLNGRKVFAGESGYRSRDPSFVGAIGYKDHVYLPLQKGLNEIFLMVGETFGGWGFMCKADRELLPPIKKHDAATKAWETPDVFKIPESVLYDHRRDVLYVSSFSRVSAKDADTGFISKVRTSGEIAELQWVTGLDGPCGMAIVGDRLYVVEGFRHNLVEIDIESGEILQRHNIPGATFLNDVAADDAGNLYISDTSRAPEDPDLYKFKDGKWELWRQTDEIHRANGLFVHGGLLLVGNTGDGCFKAVNLDDGTVRTITSLGAGVVDGIRVDPAGNYIVSHWEGQVYRISPEGDVVEILDTMAEGLNNADFELIKEKNLLVSPTFMGNKVVAYTLKP